MYIGICILVVAYLCDDRIESSRTPCVISCIAVQVYYSSKYNIGIPIIL